MKGIVFTEFLEHVEADHGMAAVDQITQIEGLHDQGAYTATGNYPHGDMVGMVVLLSEKSGVPVEKLLFTFGRYLLGRFVVLFPHYFDGQDGLFDFLTGLESVIHTEVRKLYADADPPRFEHEIRGSQIILDYHSRRPFEAVARGLLQGAVDHFGEAVTIVQEAVEGDDPTHRARFILTRNP